MNKFQQLKVRLHDHYQELMEELVPAGRLDGECWRFGDADGSAGSSTTFQLYGKHAGRWTDWAVFQVDEDVDGARGDVIDLMQRIRGLDREQAFKELDAWAEARTSGAPRKLNGKHHSKAASPVKAKAPRGKPKPGKAWPYYDADGKPLGFVRRIDYENGDKEVKPFFKPDPNARNGFAAGLTEATKQVRPLYGDTQGDGDGLLLIAEGEKATEALRQVGYKACTSQGGCGAGAKGDWSRLSQAKKVIIWRDNDEPGMKFADVVAERVTALHPGVEVLVCVDEDGPEGGDAVDLLQRYELDYDGYELPPESNKKPFRHFSSSFHRRFHIGPVMDQAELWEPPPVQPEPEPELKPGEIDEGEHCTVDLSDVMGNHPAPSYIIEPYFPVGFMTLFGGHGGTGKSTLALSMAAHVAAGMPWAEREVRQGKVLFLSLEDPTRVLKWRLKNIIQEHGLDPATVISNLHIEDCTDLTCMAHDAGYQLTFTKKAKGLIDRFKQFDLVFIDNASDAYAANESARHMVRAFTKGLNRAGNRAGCAVVLLAHVDKASAKTGSRGESYSGSTAWHNGARSRLALVNNRLVQEKNQFGPRAEPIPIQFSATGVPMPVDPAQQVLFEQRQLQNDVDLVLYAITRAIDDGENVPTNTSSTGNVWLFLSRDRGDLSDAIPRDKGGRSRVLAAIKHLSARGLIQREQYTTAKRNTREKWVLNEAATLVEEVTKTSHAEVTK